MIDSTFINSLTTVHNQHQLSEKSLKKKKKKLSELKMMCVNKYKCHMVMERAPFPLYGSHILECMHSVLPAAALTTVATIWEEVSWVSVLACPVLGRVGI
jgi:hypothetical protein